MAKAKAPDRRKFLELATGAVGTGIGIAVLAPAVRFTCAPTSETTVTSPREPIDVGPIGSLVIGGLPRRFDVRAPQVTDGWTSARDVVLGAAWIRRTGPNEALALSAVCPHLGCTVGFDEAAKQYLCPCHQRSFAIDGKNAKVGPSERPMDALPIQIVDGRLRLTWIRYQPGIADKVPV